MCCHPEARRSRGEDLAERFLAHRGGLEMTSPLFEAACRETSMEKQARIQIDQARSCNCPLQFRGGRLAEPASRYTGAAGFILEGCNLAQQLRAAVLEVLQLICGHAAPSRNAVESHPSGICFGADALYLSFDALELLAQRANSRYPRG